MLHHTHLAVAAAALRLPPATAAVGLALTAAAVVLAVSAAAVDLVLAAAILRLAAATASIRLAVASPSPSPLLARILGASTPRTPPSGRAPDAWFRPHLLAPAPPPFR